MKHANAEEKEDALNKNRVEQNKEVLFEHSKTCSIEEHTKDLVQREKECNE